MQTVVVPDRRYVVIHEDPMAYFLSGYAEETRERHTRAMNQFLTWINQRVGWAGVGPKQLLLSQLQAKDPYDVPELIQNFVNSRPDLRKAYIRCKVSAILKFFQKNRCPLPVKRNWFKIRSAVSPVQCKLTPDVIRNAMIGLPPRWRSIFLVKYQSLLNATRVCWLNVNGAEQITKQLREGQRIVRVDLPAGGSICRDKGIAHFSYFGRDAASELIRYFNEERGWPKAGEPIWPYTEEDLKHRHRYGKNWVLGGPLQRTCIGEKWMAAVRSLNYVRKKADSIGAGTGARYGYNLGEFRDVAMADLYVHANREGLDMDCVKFWGGLFWEIDAAHLGYDKFYNDSDYMERQYTIAEPYLNIISRSRQEREAQKTAHENPRSQTMTYTVSTTTTF